MPFAKGFIERLFEIRGNMTQRTIMIQHVLYVYSSDFNRIKAMMWFGNIPSFLFWHGDLAFSLNDKKSRQFKPKTIAEFIAIMQSYGHELWINLDNNPAESPIGDVGAKPFDLRLML